jgi:hypothetical protein
MTFFQKNRDNSQLILRQGNQFIINTILIMKKNFFKKKHQLIYFAYLCDRKM